MNLLDSIRRLTTPNGQKLLTMVHDGRQQWLHGLESMLLPGTNVDYAQKVGDGLQSSVLAGPLNWLMRNFPQAPPVVERLRKEEWGTVQPHPLTDKLAVPNEFYGGRELWMATILDFAFGNAYWLKIRNRVGEVVQLWWVPSCTMIPRWPRDGKTYIDHYEYRPGGVGHVLGFSEHMTVTGVGGQAVKIPVKDVVHFRFGLDPRNSRLGLSQLGALVREVYTDDEASNFASAILQNFGIIGVIISPKEKGTASPDDVKAVKEYVQEKFTGDSRGKAMALGQPTDVQLLQYNLQAFDMSPLRDVSEERVCAALGIPAAVVGFGTGLQTTKVGATMREMRRMAWTDCLMPMQETIAEQVGRQLLPDLDTAPRRRVRFDHTRVPALMEDDVEKHNRVRADYLAGIIKRSTAKQELRYPVEEGDEVYAQPTNINLLTPGTVPEPQPQNQGGDE